MSASARRRTAAAAWKVRRAVSPAAADAGIAAVIALLSLAGGLVAPGAHAPVTALLVAMSLALAARRRFPATVLAVTAAVTALLAVRCSACPAPIRMR